MFSKSRCHLCKNNDMVPGHYLCRYKLSYFTKFEVLRFLLFLYFLATDFYSTFNVYSPSLFGEIKSNERK